MTPLSIASFDTVSGGAVDNTAAIVRALAVAKAQAQPLLIPEGVWAYSDVLTADGVQVFGEGDAVLHSLNTARAALFLRGVGPEVRGIRFTGVKPTQRTPQHETTRIVAFGASRFVIEGVTVESGSGAAIIVTRASSEGRIANNRLSGTLADSIHVTDRSSYITIEDNDIANSGDDGIAVVSARAQGTPVHHVEARGNVIRDNAGGRCMSVVGGQDVLYENNELSGNVRGAGLLIAQEESYKTFGSRRVMARFNTIRNCGNAAIGHFAVMLTSSGADINSDITLQRFLIVQDDARGGIRVLTENNKAIALDSNIVLATPPMQITSTDVTVKPYAGGRVGAYIIR